ncbi:MAG TPA: Mov34/MPN/PAD-1 family protein [Acidimicrobiales bacterium]|nr:Mov34/MPN/PAD-1 family protein [Acidimicrobiales bacterium]
MQNRSRGRPVLRFAPDAWAKLVALRDFGPTEIGAFGIAAAAEPLLVVDVRLVPQRCDAARVEFADEAVADLFDRLVDAGRRPEEFARIWIHTHPGTSAAPSAVDEATFERVFGRCDWAVMAILARGGATSARLRVRSVVPLEVELATAIDFGRSFAASDPAAWRAEYDACVTPLSSFPDPWDAWEDWRWRPAREEAHDVERFA